MKVRIRRLHEDAVIPSYAHPTDAGLDITAVWRETDADGNIVYHTGLAFEIPDGHVGLLFPRSSNARKDMVLTNCVGVIDSGYRGEVTFKFKPTAGYFNDFGECVRVGHHEIYDDGDRIGQMIIMPYPKVEFEESSELTVTDRGEGGYGSTGR